MPVINESMLFGQAIALATESSARIIQTSPAMADEFAELLLEHATAPSDLVSQNRPGIRCVQTESHLLLARSIYAKQSTSSRKTSGAVTNFISIEKEYLDAFQKNPALLAHVAMTNGGLSTESDLSAGLPDLNISSRSFWNNQSLPISISESVARQVFRAIEVHDRVAIIGAAAPIRFLTALFAHCNPEQRAEQTFADNTWFGAAKSPQILLFDQNEHTRIKLVNAQIRTISLDPCA